MAIVWKWYQRENKKKPWCEVRRSLSVSPLILYRRQIIPNLKGTGQVGLQCLWYCKYSYICSVKDVEWEDSQTFCYRRAFLWRICLKNHLRTILFAWSCCLWRLLMKAAKAIETLGVINHACEGYGRSSWWGISVVSEICKSSVTFSFARSYQISSSCGTTHLSGAFAHMQASYIISARILWSQNSKRPCLLFCGSLKAHQGDFP